MKFKYTTPKVVRGWKDLPPEIHENILARLHLRDLCRSRLVCKGWNHLITQTSFRSIRANTPRRASSILITAKVLDCGARDSDWEMFEMAEKRLYTLNDPFCVADRTQFCKQYTLAADGGLIYTMNETPTGGRRHYIVRNLVIKNFHPITEPEITFSYDRVAVVMAEDKATGSFKIITIGTHTSDMSRREGEFLYASTTKGWRWLCKVLGVNHAHRAISSIFVKGVFYTLFFDMSSVPPWCPEFYSCDLETGAWSYIDVDLPRPSHPQETAQLVTSLGRLFFVEYVGLPSYNLNVHQTRSVGQYFYRKKIQVEVSIWEILLHEQKVIKVAYLLNYGARSDVEGRYDIRYDSPVAVLGCGDYVVILTVFGRHVGWDLFRNCWDELPANAVHFDSSYSCIGIFAGLVDF